VTNFSLAVAVPSPLLPKAPPQLVDTPHYSSVHSVSAGGVLFSGLTHPSHAPTRTASLARSLAIRLRSSPSPLAFRVATTRRARDADGPRLRLRSSPSPLASARRCESRARDIVATRPEIERAGPLARGGSEAPRILAVIFGWAQLQRWQWHARRTC
jgi:hypothetical protein